MAAELLLIWSPESAVSKMPPESWLRDVSVQWEKGKMCACIH